MYQAFLVDHQPAPKSRHRDLILALNIQSSLGLFLAGRLTSSNLFIYLLPWGFYFSSSVYLNFTTSAAVCLAARCLASWPWPVPLFSPSFSSPPLKPRLLLLFIFSACSSYPPLSSLLTGHLLLAQSSAFSRQGETNATLYLITHTSLHH